MMKLSKLSILCWQLAFLAFITPDEVRAGEYLEGEAAISADSGCSSVLYGALGKDQTYDYVCFGAPVNVFPDPDGVYRVTIFSGFPDEDKTSEYTHPKYRQDYTWKKYDLMTIAINNCLWVKPRGSLGPIHDEYFPWLAKVWGQCPPTEYPWSGYTTNHRNPYLMQTKDNEINKRQQQQKELDKIDERGKEFQLMKDKESSLNPDSQQPNSGLIDPAISADNTILPAPDSFYDQNTADLAAGIPAQSPPSADEFAFNSFPSKETSFNLFEAPNADTGNFFTRRTLRRHRIPIAGKQEESTGPGDSS